MAESECPLATTDREHMALALRLAARGLGRVEPNPMVGAVVASPDGRVIGQGCHERFGGPHAEVNALAAAGDAARGATLYVTLEPCCHHGKTPPCTEAVIAAGVARAVVAMGDPFAEVDGRGIRRLREAGLRVDVGLMESEARRLNAPFIKRCTTGRPYVIAKWAQTLDGRLATDPGDARWISSAESRQWVHSLRSRVDGILVGIGTALADDPLLTVRLDEGGTDYGRRPARIVLDRRLRLPADSRLVRTTGEAPLLVFTAEPSDGAAAAALLECDAEVVRVAEADGALAIGEVLADLGRRGMTNLLVEGGASVLRSFIVAGEVDRLAVFVAAKLAGGSGRHLAPGPAGAPMMSDALSLLRPTVTPIGGDALIEGVLRDW